MLLVIDLKVIRAGIDILFDTVASKPEIKIHKILDRSDQFVDDLEYMDIAEAQIQKLQKDKVKQENFKSGLTTVIGAVMQKQKCWEQCCCIIGSLIKNIPGKDLVFT